MIKSIESLENENYIISRISSFSVKSKRRVAEKGDIKLIECSRCELFKSLDEFHTNATGYLKKVLIVKIARIWKTANLDRNLNFLKIQ